MTESARNGYVLVGVDYGPESAAAAKWAVDDAQARGRDVVLAHGIPLPYGDAPMTADMVDQIVADAEALVDGLMSQLVIPPGLTVQAVIEPSPPVALLRRLAESADLVVLGRHHQNLFERMTEGSITSPLSAHAPCPVMVVPAEYGWAAGYRKPVVVALDADNGGWVSPRVRFRRGGTATSGSHGPARAPARRVCLAVNDDLVTLAEILAGWKADRPDVTVHTVILPGEPGDVIVDASTEAGVMVVGRPHQPRLGSWTRSVARAVLRAAHCPLAIVPPSQLSESGPASSRSSTSTR